MYSKLINGDAVFSQLASDWDALAQNGVTDTPFQTLAYQQAWWTHLHPTNATLHTIAVYNDAHTLIGIACFYLIEGVVYFNGCVEETDYLDVLASNDHVETVWTAVFDCLCSPEFPDWTGIDLCNIPEASPSRMILPREAEKRGFRFNESIIEVCPVIPLPNTFDAYLESIDSKQRRELRRKLRRADGAEVQLVMVQPEDGVANQVEAFLDLLQKSTFEKRDWLNDSRRQVFHDVAQAALAAGTLQLMFLQVDGRKAAALFNFSYKGRTWVYNSGLDPDDFGNLSLGVVITAKAIEKGIEVGNKTFDFLRGNETYKYRFGAIDTQIFKHQINR